KVKDTIFSRLAAHRRTVKEHIQKTFPESLINEAEALLIGDRSGMTDDEGAILRRLGITHLFAISGLHVGLLTFMMRELLLRLKVRRESLDLLLVFLLP
ncbi:ComEC/Rec2 family competence protein, partial [Microvirga sp. 3-52]|nr:ComEC/Rec2 family competence protein [Microvirga sp. 3-52]